MKMSQKKNNRGAVHSTPKNQQTTKSNQKYSKSKQNNNDTEFTYYLIPVIIILCIVPFIVRLIAYDPKLSQYSWFPNSTTSYDFFLYYKQWLFVATAVVMAVIIGYQFMKDHKTVKPDRIFIPLAVYAGLSLLSTAGSLNTGLSLSGSFEQFESVFALLGYCVTAFYIFLFIKKENDFKIIVRCLIIVAVIFSILGILQLAGHDFFASQAGYQLIIPPKYQSGTKISFKFGKDIYLTLFNPDYVGVYAAMITPIIFVMLFFQKKILWIVLSVFASIGLILCAIGSKSISGVIGLGVATACIFIFLWRYWIKRLYITIPVIVILLLGVVIANSVSGNYITDKIAGTLHAAKSEYALSALDTNKDNVSLTYNGNQVYIAYNNSGSNGAELVATDANKNVLQSNYNQTDKSYTLVDKKYNGLSFGMSTTTSGAFYIKDPTGSQWQFIKQTQDKTYYYINSYGKLDKMKTAESVLFTGYESFASTRGYIWSRSIPLIKKYIIVGCGPDTFTLAFPQQDYMYLGRCGYSNSILTKPHSMYLQMAIQTGLLSLLAFLIFYGIYFVSSIKLYIRGRFNSYYSKIGVAVFIGTFAYMITGLANDSSITTAPTFWILMGLGIVLNNKVRLLMEAEIKELNVEQKSN